MFLFFLFFSVFIVNLNAVVPHWELAGDCGECQHCLVLHGYDSPYFCVFDATEIPCYIRLHSFPSLYDTDCFENKTVIVDVTDNVVENSTVLISVETVTEPSSTDSDSKIDEVVLIKEQLSSVSG
ncbi:unnamed protein product [Caenorhabditis nigoni]